MPESPARLVHAPQPRPRAAAPTAEGLLAAAASVVASFGFELEEPNVWQLRYPLDSKSSLDGIVYLVVNGVTDNPQLLVASIQVCDRRPSAGAPPALVLVRRETVLLTDLERLRNVLWHFTLVASRATEPDIPDWDADDPEGEAGDDDQESDSEEIDLPDDRADTYPVDQPPVIEPTAEPLTPNRAATTTAVDLAHTLDGRDSRGRKKGKRGALPKERAMARRLIIERKLSYREAGKIMGRSPKFLKDLLERPEGRAAI